MTDHGLPTPPEGSGPGWYRSPADPPDTQRYWDGEHWIGDAEPIPSGDERHLDHLSAPLAGAGARIVARLFDVVLTGVVFVLIAAAIDGGVDGDADPSRLASAVSLAVAALYEVGMVARRGATLGKLLVGIEVVGTDAASPPPLAVAARRWSPILLTALPTLGPLLAIAILVLSLAWITSDPARRSLFDRVAPSYVVRRPR